jgi:hypothetical protein
MPISLTVPPISPEIAPARSRIESPTLNGWANSSTRPANTFDSACCAAMPTKTLVSAPPSSSWPTGTPNSTSVTISVVTAPMRSSAYRTTDAWDAPVTGLSTSRALPDKPIVAMLANTQNAAAVAAAMTWLITLSVPLTTLSVPKKCSKWLCAQPEVMAAPIASTSAMIDFHGLVFALTMATWADRSICGPPCTCIQQVLPSHRNRSG